MRKEGLVTSIPLLCMAFVMFVATFCFPLLSSAAEGTPSEIRQVIRVAGDNRFPPFEFEANGTFQGFNVDMMNALSIETGIKFEFYPMPWSEALKALEAGRVDAIQGMKYSKERSSVYAYSEPYFTSTQAIFVLKDNYSVFSLGDLQHRKTAVQEGDISGEALQRLQNAVVLAEENQDKAIKMLLDHKVDAFIGNQITGQYLLQSNGQQDKVKLVGDPISPTDYGMVVLKRNEQLLEPINVGLRKIKTNGTYPKIERKWFGEYIYPSPRNIRGLLTYFIIGLFAITCVLLIILWWNFTLKKELKKRVDTYKKTLDELARKDRMQSLGQLVAGIAHEIRNPITSILSYAQLLPTKYENKEYREFFAQHVTGEVMRLNRIVGELLDFSRDKPPEKATFHIGETIQAVVLLFQQLFEKQRIVVRLEVPETCVAWADAQQIKQVLINLFKNAIDAMEDGGQLQIKAYSDSPHVMMTIEDTGQGIDPQDLANIYEPFFTRKTGGVGLGLSICYQLMTENNGGIEVVSRKGTGTKVTLKLPGEQEENEHA
ncbi:transporter substrate-binding domain-containing protein [Paenibacillus alginolyticus]|uniref:histidine kinase n=1 Tax=Paenibacillus alginolyticus TaxID=59839 RepID=A0ABT4GDA9_9BACL|nr:transporter substrate-binding domain-containing protein [Paenibacillus alginolyticus]MCY9666640.1 transporter substrate-binding domain-containing protein [Paenibacillus alginolyticus]MCY9694146.1 transporter substrate-binding domain-containing protein [Paenibacillus alginolyticus]MEC0142385.1 transporter substrate-binding domain-containing protein [Paenibacillus alginolyticus]